MFVREIVFQKSPIFFGKVEEVDNHLLCRFCGVKCCKYTFCQYEKNGNNIILWMKEDRKLLYKKQIASRTRTATHNHHGEKLRFKTEIDLNTKFTIPTPNPMYILIRSCFCYISTDIRFSYDTEPKVANCSNYN